MHIEVPSAQNTKSAFIIMMMLHLNRLRFYYIFNAAARTGSINAHRISIISRRKYMHLNMMDVKNGYGKINWNLPLKNSGVSDQTDFLLNI